ncbi:MULTISPECIES: hypothetical protein [Shewanella]
MRSAGVCLGCPLPQ